MIVTGQATVKYARAATAALRYCSSGRPAAVQAVYQ
jgi:hypothetical protein